jgi:hypothetical protein
MKRWIFAACAVMSMILCAAAIAVPGWHVVKQKSASGQFATVATSATLGHPNGIAVNLEGGSGFTTWACSRGVASISSYSSNPGPGFHILAHTGGASSCDVVASVGGSGHVVVQILTR